MKILWLLTGVFGCGAIILGALGAHVLKDFPDGEIAAFETGVRYHLIHAIAAGLALVLAERAGGLAVVAVGVFLRAVQRCSDFFICEDVLEAESAVP